jgi:DNA-binding GntR family transcriptional regulator
MFEAVRFTIAEFTEAVPEAFKDPRLPSLHQRLYRAIEAGDGVEAAKAVRRHFRANRPRMEFKIRTGGEAPGPPAPSR